MLTYQECLDLCELAEDEVAAIAEHEHLTEIAAMELGNYLIHTPEGVPMIKRMILDDIHHARAEGNLAHAARLRLVLRHFVENHPEHPRGGRS